MQGLDAGRPPRPQGDAPESPGTPQPRLAGHGCALAALVFSFQMAEQLMTLAYDNGINLFDTAEVYAAGKYVSFSHGESAVQATPSLERALVLAPKCPQMCLPLLPAFLRSEWL